MWSDFAFQILDVTADIGVEEARRLVRVRTGATRDSIGKDPVIYQPGGVWSVIYGPTTPYAPFLEYGTVRAQPYPFMNPSADLAERALVPSVVAFLDLLCGGSASGLGTGLGGEALNSPQIRGTFTQLRTFLYSTSKFLGDLSVFGGRELFGPIRASMLSFSRLLGDVSATMNSTIGQRVTNRLRGRATGHIIGYGSRSLSYDKSYSAFIGGAGGHRIYQRVAGRFGVSSLNIPGVSGFGGFGR